MGPAAADAEDAAGPDAADVDHGQVAHPAVDDAGADQPAGDIVMLPGGAAAAPAPAPAPAPAATAARCAASRDGARLVTHADMDLRMVDRATDGHCDCAFWVNYHRWCWSDIGALIAPRAFLIASGSEDVLWRPSPDTAAQADLLLGALIRNTGIAPMLRVLRFRDSPLKAAAMEATET